MTVTTLPAWAKPTPVHPHGCPCVTCTLESVLVLIGSGRNEMGYRLLVPLPERIGEALAEARGKGVEEGKAQGATVATWEAASRARADLAAVRAQVEEMGTAKGVL